MVIGYDETEKGPVQTGSHNLILGEENAFLSYGGIVSGVLSAISGDNASAISGYADTASGADSFIASGEGNRASYYLSAVFGGDDDLASDQWATVTGGRENVLKASTPLWREVSKIRRFTTTRWSAAARGTGRLKLSHG